ncbi:MAG TPA: hypothetical protein VK177_21380 [Flavobacteriales bacterium]|nr:hypothetical protein [Flavobacteriales bacterium]
MKKYLAREDFELVTLLKSTDVINRIAENTGPKKTFRLALPGVKHDKPYEGVVDAESFKISRVINYKNSFLPVISGTVSGSGKVTAVTIKMRMLLPVRIFMFIWLGGVGLACIFITPFILSGDSASRKQGFDPMALIPFAMFVFGYLLTYLAFKFESRKSKAFLKDLLNAQEGSD